VQGHFLDIVGAALASVAFVVSVVGSVAAVFP
jgi:hypothetical protein